MVTYGNEHILVYKYMRVYLFVEVKKKAIMLAHMDITISNVRRTNYVILHQLTIGGSR